MNPRIPAFPGVLRTVLLAATIVAAGLSSATPIVAGCGCDHPPPVHGVVYPRFASAGSEVSIQSPVLKPGGRHCLEVGGRRTDLRATTETPPVLLFTVPTEITAGPWELRVWSKRCSRVDDTTPSDTLPQGSLTVLPAPLPIIERTGTVRYANVEAAVDMDGRILVPFDLTNVIAPIQFFFSIKNRPVRFTNDDVGFYNKDEFNLKLFAMEASGPEDHQWGPYYGTSVFGSSFPTMESDVLSYWRHDFESYALAHLPGGSHEANANGRHPDGTLHVDHNLLVLAIDGKIKDLWSGKLNDIPPGRYTADVEIRQIISDAPVAFEDLDATQQKSITDHVILVERSATGEITVTEDVAPEADPFATWLKAFSW